MGVKRSAAERALLIEKYKASGLSISKFVVQENIPLSTFHAWLSSQTKPKKAVKFLRVAPKAVPEQITHSAPTPAPAASVLVEFCDCRIHIHAGCETSTLSTVLACLERYRPGAQQ